MADLISKRDIPQEIRIPDDWEYDTSVRHFTNLHRAVRKHGAGALVELYVAWALLTEDSKKKKNRCWPDKTFDGYCDEIGISRKTVNRWLRIYFGINQAIGTNDPFPLTGSIPTIWRQNAQLFLKKIKPKSVDLLLTDPPYSTDVKNLSAFVRGWLPLALSRVKPEGRAYICIGAYPNELREYLNCVTHKNHKQEHISLDQVLVWTYRNTLGPQPKMTYIQTQQDILYFIGCEAPPLACPTMVEQFDVQDISAPDGRHDGRWHKWEKPVELARRFITHSTSDNDIVLDPFAGTGTFAIVATSLGRKVLACDNDPEILKLAKERGCDIR